MMLGRIIGTMLQCVKKKMNVFVTFCSCIFIYFIQYVVFDIWIFACMLQCSIKAGHDF